MRTDRQIARDISYSYSAQTKGGRAMIRTMENLTGRISLIKRAAGYETEVSQGRDFWEVIVERHILSQTRGDFRILAHQIFRKAEDLNKVILPISFDETKEAVALNLATRKTALDYLGQGGAIGIFPGGTVSTAAKPFSRPMDPGWRGFTAKMIAKSQASVVPVYFDGHTSRLFQLASHLHVTLRMGLLIKEFRKRVDTPVRVVVGDPIPRNTLAQYAGDTKSLMAFLRAKTYELSPSPIVASEIGFEFE